MTMPASLDTGTLEQWRVEVAEHITALKTVDNLGPTGAYHEV